MPERTIADRFFQFKETIPPGTTNPGAPQVSTVPIAHGIFETLALQVPSGHVGLTGFSMRLAGTQIVPWEAGAGYIVAEDDVLHFDVNIEVDIQLEVACYNLDIYDHSFYYRIGLRYIDYQGPRTGPVAGVLSPGPVPLIQPFRLTP